MTARQWNIARRMTPGTGGGRFRNATPTPAAVLARARTAAGAGGCLIEAYDGADDDVLGYDLDWDVVCAPFRDGAYDYDDGTYNDTTDNVGLEVVDNTLAVTMRPGPVGTSTDARSNNLARTQQDVAGDDVHAELVIAGIPSRTHLAEAVYGIGVRMEDDPMHLIANAVNSGYPAGIYALVHVYPSSYDISLWVWPRPGFGEDVFSSGLDRGSLAGVFGPPGGFAVAEGDKLSLDVSGQPVHGGGLHIVAALNGTAFLDLTEASIETTWGDATVWDYMTWPSGRRAGVYTIAQISTGHPFSEIDHDTRVDNFAACAS